MVLGARSKSRRGPTVSVEYIINIQVIKPWPPTQSLKTIRSVLIQWENGEKSSGTTNAVTPVLRPSSGEGKIEFNESFRLPVTLLRDLSIKAGDSDTFQKNCLEFNLYEPRRDKTVKGQLLGTAIVDLADYGVVKDTLSVSVVVNCQRNFRNTAQPILYVNIQRVRKGHNSSSSRDSLLNDASLDRNGGESVSALMNEEYAEEAELASLTDDDVSSHSSLSVTGSAYVSNGGSPPQNDENSSEKPRDDTGGTFKQHTPSSNTELEKSSTPLFLLHRNQQENQSRSSSIDLSSGPDSPANGHGSLSNVSESSIKSIPEEIVAPKLRSSSSSTTYVVTEGCNSINRSNGHKDLDQDVHEKDGHGRNEIGTTAEPSNGDSTLRPNFKGVVLSDAVSESVRVDIQFDFVEGVQGDREQEKGQGYHIMGEKSLTSAKPVSRFPQDTSTKEVTLGSDAFSNNSIDPETKGITLTSHRLRHVRSVRSLSDSGKSINGLVKGSQFVEDVKEIGIAEDAQNGSTFYKLHLKEAKIQKLENRIKVLEGELREAAAVEVALYSVVAEHGSSMSKVHAPARRLSRLYLHACKDESLSRRANAARAATSGLLLVAKACGNDVPRLTFWLSNSILLRIIISQAVGDSQSRFSSGPSMESTRNVNVNRSRPSPLKWESSSSLKEINGLCERVGDWGDPNSFTSALEKIEAWIFNRVIESIWWQTLTPHMQSAAAKAIDEVGSNSSKSFKRVSSSGDHEKGNISLELWKRAFQDASERLCPVRAGGHECGCLPLLTKLIMEQCVARLDVAMCNAILRQSDNEMPTDPVSDPISDPKVLPVPAGNFSFGAGAQLKNAIGNWSRLLSDLFGMDDDILVGDENDQNGDDYDNHDTSFKSFHILNALSGLMMLPKDLLLSRSIRKEVCPTFGASLIKRVLNSFVPDEFCPDPVPDIVLEALNFEDTQVNEESVTNYPCMATPTVYSPPTIALVARFLGEITSSQLRRSGSSVLRKSYTSDDELDELDSPLSSIFMDTLRYSPNRALSRSASKRNGNPNTVRYQLLREVWMDSV